MKSIETLAIANRGEVAVRIIHACKELGIKTILLHSEADENSLAYRICDKAICVGPSPVSESYLNIKSNIDGAIVGGADAIHPGFGFLSENAAFAKACQDKKIIFVGPSPESIGLFGDKISAKSLVEKLNIKTIPGYQGHDQSTPVLIDECDRIGYPVIIKAAAGGGGRGMKIANNRDSASEAIESAKREALSAFGNGTVFLEKYLDRAKHIEVQVFADYLGNVYHLYDRECTIQRRHQKIIEESLTANLNDKMRDQILESAVKIAKAAKYLGAGTLEFLVQENEFYFMEMNTRLQVEHPVTELVMGVDLVKAQILTAMERGPLWSQMELNPRGHSIECRLYAEDPFNMGIPSIGKILDVYWPMGPGRRFDFGFEAGDEVTSFYDSMIAKVIVWDETRIKAIQKMRQTLKEIVIFGIQTNIPYLLAILEHPDFISGEMTTQFIQKYFPMGLTNKPEMPEELLNVLKMDLSSIPNHKKTHSNPWQKSLWKN